MYIYIHVYIYIYIHVYINIRIALFAYTNFVVFGCRRNDVTRRNGATVLSSPS